jgi:uncharacterized membrane protein
MFGFGRKVIYFLSDTEKTAVHEAVKQCEKDTDGEVRVYIESKNAMMDPLDRAKEVFFQYEMDNTHQRSGVLIYIAYKDREFAIYGDTTCMDKFPSNFWVIQAKILSAHFSKNKYVDGIQKSLDAIREEFLKHFTPAREKKNELPDEIIFGK